VRNGCVAGLRRPSNLQLTQIRCYLINLDRSVDRLRFMTRQSEALRFRFERIPATDGESLSPSQVPSRALHGLLGPLSPAEIGCYLSHRNAWQRIWDWGEPWGIVLEDDIAVGRDFSRITGNLDWLPFGSDIAKLEASPAAATLVSRTALSVLGDRRLHRLAGFSRSTAAYAIARTTCQKLLAMPPSEIAIPIDRYLFDPQYGIAGSLAVYIMNPAPVVQLSATGEHVFDSLIAPDRDRRIRSLAALNKSADGMPLTSETSRLRREIARIAKRLGCRRAGMIKITVAFK
jgi:glycosyl transferase family 25